MRATEPPKLYTCRLPIYLPAMDAIGKLFGFNKKASDAAERSAAGQAQAAHAQAEDSKRRRVVAEQEGATATRPRDASMFLANRGTRYSGLKPSLGG